MRRMNPNDLNRWIGFQIRQARIARKLSQELLAEAADLSRVFISQLENGNTSAKIGTYYRITCAFDISLGELFQGSENKKIIGDALFLLSDCSKDEVRSYTEILRVVKAQFVSLRR